jgi:hypothetical protein
LHPYDDPVYLESLPDTHPANPNSEVARAARAKHEEIEKTMQKKKATTGSSSSSGRQDVHSAAQAAMAGGSASRAKEERSIGGTLKDKLLGSTKEERRKAKLEQQARDRVCIVCFLLVDLLQLIVSTLCDYRKLHRNILLEGKPSLNNKPMILDFVRLVP